MTLASRLGFFALLTTAKSELRSAPPDEEIHYVKHLVFGLLVYEGTNLLQVLKQQIFGDTVIEKGLDDIAKAPVPVWRFNRLQHRVSTLFTY